MAPYFSAPTVVDSRPSGPSTALAIRALSDRTEDSDDDNEQKPKEVPDVLYVVRYHGFGGRLMDTRESDMPLDPDTSYYDNVKVDKDKKKPIIEIATKVAATSRQRRGPRHPRGRHYPPPPYGVHEYYSDEEVIGEGGGGREVKVTRVETTRMIVHSIHLQNAIKAVVNYYPDLEVNYVGDQMCFDAPYSVLVLHRHDLAHYKNNQPAAHDGEYAATTAQHIDVLLGFLDRTYGAKIRAEEARWRHATPTATFEWFWLALKPGSVMYARRDSRWTPFVVSRVIRPIPREDRGDSHGPRSSTSTYVIEGWNIQYCNGQLQRFMASFNVQPFHGEQVIHSLAVVPARFFPAGEKTTAEKQIALGKMCWELSKKPAYKEYDGGMVAKHGYPSGHLTGRVIIDCEGYDLFEDDAPEVRTRRRSRSISPRRPNGAPPPAPPRMLFRDTLPLSVSKCSCQLCSKAVVGLGRDLTAQDSPWTGFEDLDPNEAEMPKNDLYFHVLDDTLPAFLLGERRWGHVQAEFLSEVKPDREAFKYLVLDDDIKLTVKALTGKFTSDGDSGKVSPWPSDFVKNKGEGRIFLLHGSPGVGKTCTAECVAELTNRPLLNLTSGDISTSVAASAVERSLSYFLQLGERYGALVLIDEADVYLERRRTRDLMRNGLVSIFLRALEYYRGVLFLTTNRVSAFDAAFTSRVHVALHYRRLSDDDRARVWSNTFDRLERDSGARCYVAKAAREFVLDSDDVKELKWNGREIRNALQTAVALAETEAVEDGAGTVTVREEHIRAVVKMSSGFKDFLRTHKYRNGDEVEDMTDSSSSEEEGDEETGYDSDESSRSFRRRK